MRKDKIITNPPRILSMVNGYILKIFNLSSDDSNAHVEEQNIEIKCDGRDISNKIYFKF